MIAPVLPYAIRGVVWYQGEANSPRSPAKYAELFPAMITGWRAEFGQGDFPFYWVQLPKYKASGAHKTEWAIIRERQTDPGFAKHGQAVAIDTGDVDYIHPGDKKPIGPPAGFARAAPGFRQGRGRPRTGREKVRAQRCGLPPHVRPHCRRVEVCGRRADGLRAGG